MLKEQILTFSDGSSLHLIEQEICLLCAKDTVRPLLCYLWGFHYIILCGLELYKPGRTLTDICLPLPPRCWVKGVYSHTWLKNVFKHNLVL